MTGRHNQIIHSISLSCFTESELGKNCPKMTLFTKSFSGRLNISQVKMLNQFLDSLHYIIVLLFSLLLVVEQPNGKNVCLQIMFFFVLQLYGCLGSIFIFYLFCLCSG